MRLRPSGSELLRAAAAVLVRLRSDVAIADRALVDEIEGTMLRAMTKLEQNEPATATDAAALENARVHLRGRISEGLPAAARYDARLVAKSVAIGANELANGLDPERAELDRVAGLLGEPAPLGDDAGAVRGLLAKYNARLCAHIRAGALDPDTPRHHDLIAHLRASTTFALAESNPAYARIRPHEQHADRAIE